MDLHIDHGRSYLIRKGGERILSCLRKGTIGFLDGFCYPMLLIIFVDKVLPKFLLPR
jgi:hypothetical protein